jgi:general secretion pathway protein H
MSARRPATERGFTMPAAERGFTMIEMLVVLAILGMAMLAIPSIVSGLNGTRLRAASDELIARLREIRGQAIRRDATADVVFELARRGYSISLEPGFRPLPRVVDRVEVGPAGLVQASDVARPDAARIDTARTGTARIRFMADGTATPARITLHHGGGATVIVIDRLTGRVGHGT